MKMMLILRKLPCLWQVVSPCGSVRQPPFSCWVRLSHRHWSHISAESYFESPVPYIVQGCPGKEMWIDIQHGSLPAQQKWRLCNVPLPLKALPRHKEGTLCSNLLVLDLKLLLFVFRTQFCQHPGHARGRCPGMHWNKAASGIFAKTWPEQPQRPKLLQDRLTSWISQLLWPQSCNVVLRFLRFLRHSVDWASKQCCDCFGCLVLRRDGVLQLD